MTLRKRTSHSTARRGLTLVELTLATAITAMIGAAIAVMMATVSQGVASRRDTRSVMTIAHAASSRLEAYLSSSRCFLGLSDDVLAVWFDDSRESETVHASEVRWIWFDADAQQLLVGFIQFPDTMVESRQAKLDKECPSNTDWNNLFRTFEVAGYTKTVVLADNLENMTGRFNHADVMDANLVQFLLEFSVGDDVEAVTSTHALRMHEQPVR